jgi:RNA polymerase sigma-70 factor, ECF subfamily
MASIAPAAEPVVTDRAADRADDMLFRRLYDEHAAALFDYAFERTRGDWHLAEDVVQETMMRVWRNVDRINFDHNLRPLLCTVARRVLIDDRRARCARPREVAIQPDLDAIPAADDTDRILLATILRQALEMLTNAHRDVLMELYLADRKMWEAAITLGLPAGTVKSRAYYGIRALRQALRRLGITHPY